MELDATILSLDQGPSGESFPPSSEWLVVRHLNIELSFIAVKHDAETDENSKQYEEHECYHDYGCLVTVSLLHLDGVDRFMADLFDADP